MFGIALMKYRAGITLPVPVSLEKHVEEKRAMPFEGRPAVVAISGDVDCDVSSAGAPLGADNGSGSDFQAGWSSASTQPDPPTAADRRAHKIRSWRRRALLKRGVRLHTAMGTKAQQCSLAMLDESGVVISWYGSADGNDHASEEVVNRHLSQFYVPEDIAKRQPARDLRAATVQGSISREAWRRRPDGSAFLGTIVIEAVVLRDGRLQGFSYVASTPGPSHAASVAATQNLPGEDLLRVSG